MNAPSSCPAQTVFLHERHDVPAPAVTVVIPLHNYAHFVGDALASVAAQTAGDLDLVVVDDCSTDESCAVACQWMESHAARFRKALVLRHPVNRGLAATRNTAFHHCQTEFVLPLDADNQLYPGCVEKLARGLSRSRAAFAYCILERFGTADEEALAPFLMHIHPWCPEELAKFNTIDAMVLLRRKIWEEVGGYDQDMPCPGWEDYDFWFKIARLGAYGLHVPQILARYRVHPASMLNTITNCGRNPESLIAHLRRTYPEFFGDAEDGGVRSPGTGIPPLDPPVKRREAAPADVIDEIDPWDEMFTGNTRHYFETGRSALAVISTALQRAGRETCRSILDLPCGHGRVMRHLRSAFPDATIDACDLDRAAVDFCARTFGARGTYSSRRIEDVAIPGRFDLIWCGSLLTHLARPWWGEFLSWFAGHLAPGGMLVFTTHGQFSADLIKQGTCTYGIEAGYIPGLLEAYENEGFGYAPYPQTPDYGISLSSTPWVLQQIREHSGLGLVLLEEKGWADHHDVYACIAGKERDG